ncbi:MAG TPA: glycosyltransferase family 87 protein [Acidimicrobiales bacterium]|nr:glycosyltransferase family 87 protein [Acidimicrobiales bacterium]
MAFAASKSSVPGGAAVALGLAADPLGAPWLTRVARAVAVALALAFVIAVVSGSGADTASGRLGGDYPAFFAAGRLITSDERSSMYDPARQAEAQQGLFPGDADDGLLYFAYPPHTALAYLPLSHLPYRVSYALHTLLMLGATVAALYLVRPMLPLVDRHFELAVIGAVSFYPMYRAITGGQNTALTLLLLAGSWRAVEGRRDVLGGVLLGLLLFKPQFALPIIGLHLLARRWRLGVSAALTAVACWGIGAALLGFDWLGEWFESVRIFSDLDAHVNRRNAVSFLGVADTVFGVGDNFGRALGGTLALATVVALIALWRSHGRRSLCAPMIVALPAIVLISPHAMFYDAGLLVLALAAMLAARHVHVRQAAAVLWCAGVLDLTKHAVGLTPLFAVTIAVFVIALVNARRYEPLPTGLRP